MVDLNLEEGINLFNESDYFEAHDWFEDKWMDTFGENQNFLQGLVHLSVGSYHLASKNYLGALSQFSKASKKLEKYPNTYKKINLLQLREDINNIIKQISLFYSKKSFNFEIVKIPFIKINT